jgi:hypothetical protein
MRHKRLPMATVPRPCSVSWTSMSGTDKARLCAVCERHVYDLSAMSSPEAEKLLDCGDERICVRLTRGPDGQIITTDRPARFRQRPWLPFVPAAALATFLGLSETQSVHASAGQNGSDVVSNVSHSGGLRGKLSVDYGDDIPADAEVIAYNVETGLWFRTGARKDGTYRLPLPRGRYRIEYKEPGFPSCGLDDFRAGWLPMRVDVTFSIPPLGEYIASPCSTYDPRNFVIRMTTAPFRALKRLFHRDDS